MVVILIGMLLGIAATLNISFFQEERAEYSVVFSDAEMQEDERLVQDNMQTIEEIGLVRVFGRLKRQQDDERAKKAFRPIGEAIAAQLLHMT